jgi:hypothetical protein
MPENRRRVKAREITADPRLWVQLKFLLAWEIEQGILEPGDEVALTLEARDFWLSAGRAQLAFRALVDEGEADSCARCGSAVPGSNPRVREAGLADNDSVPSRVADRGAGPRRWRTLALQETYIAL